MRYRLIRAVLPVFALLACWSTVRAASFNIVVNGRLIDTGGVPPAVVNGHLLVPLAAIGNAMGAYLEWRPATRTVYGRMSGNEFTLPVNSATATVNGQTRTLEAPATIQSGRTMVPLRFVAEALGAGVKYEGTTRTVYVDAQGGAATNPPTTGTTTPPTALTINRFYVTPNTPLKAGDTFTVTLEGTPGVHAEFDFGSQRSIALPEVSPGIYRKEVRVQADAPFARNVVIGRLVSGTSSREVQAGDRVVVDTQPPVIGQLRPENGASVATTRPYVSAEFDDQGQTGVDPATVKLTVDGSDVTSEASVSADSVVYRTTLATGQHKAHVEAADLAGNRAAADWSFTITGQQTTEPPAPPTITEPAAGKAVTGNVTVRGTAQPGTTVRVRTTYKGAVLVVFSQQGEVNAQEVPVGADGKWATEPFALSTPSGVRNVEYTITATATDSQGLTSEPTQVTVPGR